MELASEQPDFMSTEQGSESSALGMDGVGSSMFSNADEPALHVPTVASEAESEMRQVYGHMAPEHRATWKNMAVGK